MSENKGPHVPARSSIVDIQIPRQLGRKRVRCRRDASMRPICICFSLLFCLLLLFSAPRADGQTCPTSAASDQLVCVIPQLYCPAGLVLPNTHHAAHFRSASLQNFAP